LHSAEHLLDVSNRDNENRFDESALTGGSKGSGVVGRKGDSKDSSFDKLHGLATTDAV